MQLIFASNNQNKLQEIQQMILDTIKITNLKEEGIFEEIEEPYFTFQENARAKADFIFQKTGKSCFAEDSGLVVPALNGEPGVLSARYAGEPSNDEANNRKLLNVMQNVKDKSAFYQSVICLNLEGNHYYFEGKCHGAITTNPRGTQGFGYDPLFIPKGFQKTFGEFSLIEKNQISHRSKAMKQFVDFLNLKFRK